MTAADTTDPAILAVDGPDFTARAECRNQAIAAHLSGTADLNVKLPLDQFLEDLHHLAKTQGVFEVVMNFRDLKFINSSCLKGLVTWICRVHESPGDAQYRISLVSSPEMHWQRRCLHALSCLAPELVTVH